MAVTATRGHANEFSSGIYKESGRLLSKADPRAAIKAHVNDAGRFLNHYYQPKLMLKLCMFGINN